MYRSTPGWNHYRLASELLADADKLDGPGHTDSEREKARQLRATASIHATLAQAAATALLAGAVPEVGRDECMAQWGRLTAPASVD